MLGKITQSITDEDFHDLIEMFRGYKKAVSAICDAPETPEWEEGFANFLASYRVGYKALNNEINSWKLQVERSTTTKNTKANSTKSYSSGGTGSFHFALK